MTSQATINEQVTPPVEQGSNLMKIIQKKYLWILILGVALAAFLPSYLQGSALIISYIFLIIFLALCYLMHKNLYYFQKFGFKYRPFLVTKWIQYLSIIGALVLLIYTIPGAVTSGEWIPYVILWVIILLIPYQFYSIFQIAKHHKEEDPTRCEFC